MIVVTPETKTTLLLNRYYQAFAFCTARAAIRHFAAGRVKAIDAENNTHDFESWCGKYVQYHPDQPALRSANQTWAIPTVIICSHSFGVHRRTCENSSMKSIYNIYRGVCQYCLEKIPVSKATKDHIYPKSRGGSNHDFNIVLACRECNGEKDNHYPYFDINGKEVKPLKITYFDMTVRNMANIRGEWKQFLHLT